VKYRIISYDNQAQVESEVSRCLDEGWKLRGFLSVTPNSERVGDISRGSPIFTQVMIKDGDVPSPFNGMPVRKKTIHV
jgi:hypothetical protein